MPSGCYTVNWCYGILKYMDSAHVYSLWNNVATTAELTTILCWHVLLELEVALFPSHSHTGGGARQRISSCTISPRAGSQNANKAASILLTVQGARDGSTRNRNYYCQAQPPVCNRMWPDLPGLRPPYSRTASDQILEVGTAWERGYAGSCVIQPLFLIIYSHALSRSRAILYHIKLPVGKILDLK